jgi:PAS domain S-box-containing protein
MVYQIDWTFFVYGSAFLLLVLLLTALVVILSQRRGDLARQMSVRTAELQQSEQRYRAFFNTSQDCVFITSVEGTFIDFNDAAVEFFGYESREELHAVKVTDIYARLEDRAAHTAVVQAKGFSREHPVQLRKKDGTVISALITAIAQRDSDGRLIGFQGSIRDITEREKVEQEMRDANKRLNDMIEFLPDATFMIDRQGKVIAWNKAIEIMTGYSKQDMLGKGDYEYAIPFYGERRPILIDYALLPAEQFELSDRYEIIRKGDFLWGEVLIPQFYEGQGAYISGTAAKLYDSSGEIVGAIESIRDVTQRKRAQDALVETNEQLEQAIARANEMALQAELANMAKSEFLANMSHEIRTPMNGVIGMSGLLLDTELSGEQRQYAELVRASGEALLKVINDILDFSKIEARKLDLEILDFNLRSTLEDVTELLAFKAQEKGLELVCLIDPETPMWLRGDPGRLRQILVNLGGNAVKFTHQGGVTIRAGLERQENHRAVVRFAVSDTGIGIPADRRDALFSPFTQVDGSTTRKYGGTGLGLSISKQLVELMGGRIGVESLEGSGSTFSFTAVFEKQSEDIQHPADAFLNLAGVRVLVVDDHDVNRLLATSLARSWGCRVEEAADGKEALSLLRAAVRANDPYQAALLDMQMPEMNGEELGRLIKVDPECKDTVLIMMTSLGQRGDARRLEALGFAAYLTKPIRQGQLHDCLALALGRKIAEKSAPDNHLITRHTVAEARLRGARILLTEDNITNQQVAVALLKKLGCRADVAANGKEALEALRTIPYDLVLMDCHMPEMDGYEATRRIRDPHSSVRDHTIPVIAMTARVMTGDREECLEAGMNDHLAKPVDPKALAEMLDKWLGDETRNWKLETGGGDETRNWKLETRGGVTGEAGETRNWKLETEERTGIVGQGVGSEGAATDSDLEGTHSEFRVSSFEFQVSNPVFDKAALMGRVMGDEELLKVVILAFLEDLPKQFEALKAFLEAGDAPGAERQAHTIKGAAGSIGGEALREAASEIEKAGRAGNLQAVSALMPELEQQRTRLEEKLKLET